MNDWRTQGAEQWVSGFMLNFDLVKQILDFCNPLMSPYSSALFPSLENNHWDQFHDYHSIIKESKAWAKCINHEMYCTGNMTRHSKWIPQMLLFRRRRLWLENIKLMVATKERPVRDRHPLASKKGHSNRSWTFVSNERLCSESMLSCRHNDVGNINIHVYAVVNSQNTARCVAMFIFK